MPCYLLLYLCDLYANRFLLLPKYVVVALYILNSHVRYYEEIIFCSYNTLCSYILYLYVVLFWILLILNKRRWKSWYEVNDIRKLSGSIAYNRDLIVDYPLASVFGTIIPNKIVPLRETYTCFTGFLFEDLDGQPILKSLKCSSNNFPSALVHGSRLTPNILWTRS